MTHQTDNELMTRFDFISIENTETALSVTKNRLPRHPATNPERTNVVSESKGSRSLPAGQTWMFTGCVAVFLLFLSCDEPFPLYEEPVNVLEGEIEVISPDTVEAFFDPLADQWFVNTPLIFKVNVTNMHDDLLQGEALVEGLITVQSFSEIPRTIVVPLTTGNLLIPPVFQGNIALGPGAKAEFSALTVPVATDGKMVFEGLPGPIVFGPIDFIASAEVQIFERVQAIRVKQYPFSLAFKQVLP